MRDQGNGMRGGASGRRAHGGSGWSVRRWRILTSEKYKLNLRFKNHCKVSEHQGYILDLALRLSGGSQRLVDLRDFYQMLAHDQKGRSWRPLDRNNTIT